MRNQLDFFGSLTVGQLEQLHKEGYDFIAENGQMVRVEINKTPAGKAEVKRYDYKK